METNKPTEPNPPRSRLEDEILEILQRTDRPPSKVIQFKSKAQQERTLRVQRLRSLVTSYRITSLHLLVGCLVLAILAAVVDHSSPFIGKFLALASIACLILVFVRSFRSPSTTPTKRWRGRDIDFQEPDGNWRDRFKGSKPPKR